MMKTIRRPGSARRLFSALLCPAVLLSLVPSLSIAVRAAEDPAQPVYATREYVVSEIVQSAGRGLMDKSDYLLYSFSDADEIGEEYVDDVSRALNEGILRGYGDNTLHPKDNVRRIEALVMLSRILPQTEAVRDPIEFSDVPAWAKEEIDRLSAAGVVNGYGDGRLGSDDFITVEQVGLLTDRSDALLNRYSPGESYFAYINDKFFRNYVPEDYELDPRYGVVTPGEFQKNPFLSLADEIREQEDELLRRLGSGELEYEKGSPAQRLYDLYETWTCVEEDGETDRAFLGTYTDLLLDADTPEAFLDACAAFTRDTGVFLLFDLSYDSNIPSGSVYPSLSVYNYYPPATLAFDPESEAEYRDDCLNALKDYAALECGFTEKDAEAAYELQEQLGAGTDYYYAYEQGLKYSFFDGSLPEWDEYDLYSKLKRLKDAHPEFYGEDVEPETLTLTLEEASDVFSDPLLDVVSLLSDVGYHDFDRVMISDSYAEAMHDVRITADDLGAWKLTALLNLRNEMDFWDSPELKDASLTFSYYSYTALFGGVFTPEEYKDMYGDTPDGEEKDAPDEEEPEDGDEESEDTEEEPGDADEPEPFEDVIRDLAASLLPDDVARLRCEYYYDPDVTQDTMKITNDLMNAYREHFKNTELFDDETEAAAEKKLDNMLISVGWRDDDSPEILSRAEGGTYLINTCRIGANQLRSMIRMCSDKTYLRQLFFVDFDDANACYSAFANSITINAGILGGAFYDPDASYAQKLGSIGMVIGHEIGHAFDDNGALYDENGVEANWWSEASAAAFEEIKDRFLTYYSRYEAMPGILQDAEVSIGENMADFSSMLIITDYFAGDPDAQRAALEAFASLWAEVLPYDLKYYYLTDEHPANQLRVNAIVSSLDCFYELYDIGEDDPMYVAPEDRLRLW